MARHLFFSYAHSDAERLLPFYAALQEKARPGRHYIWIDRGLVGGDLWENRIRLAIQNSYGIFLALTKTFITRPFILEKEIPWAFERFPATLSDAERLPIFPILFDKLPKGWETKHPSLKRAAAVQYIDAVGREPSVVIDDLLKLLPPAPTRSSFIVSWPRLPNFKGRRETLNDLHEKLLAGGKAGITTVAALHGTGGVGKTQLAVEYAHQYGVEYPGGVFWINAAADWRREFAGTAERLGLLPKDANDPERDKQLILSFRDYLNGRGAAREPTLIILDNVEQPADVGRREIGPRLPVETLCEETGARLLLTTRVADMPAAFTTVRVDVLRPNDAREVLLNAWTGDSGRSDAPDEAALDALARALGFLPLALGWMAAALRALPDLAPAELLGELRAGGIDEVIRQLDAQDIKLGTPGHYEALVGAALSWQLRQLKGDEPMLLLALIAAFGEAAAVPLARLRLLSGLKESGLKRPFTTGIRALQKFSLVEMLQNNAALRLHPLTRDHLRRTMDVPAALVEAAPRLVAAYRDPQMVDSQTRERGFVEVVNDLSAVQDALTTPNDDLKRLARLFMLEEGNLLRLPERMPGYIAGQIRGRAHHEGDEAMRDACDGWLRGKTHFRAAPESRYPAGALIRVLRGHEREVRGALALPDGRLLSWSSDRTLRLWASDGRELSVLRGHEDEVYGVLALPDGRLLSWSSDRTLRLWASDGRELSVLRGHEDEVRGALALPDGRLLSWSRDRTLRLWASDGRELSVLRGHEDGVYGALALPDGRLLSWLGGFSADGRLWLWASDGRELSVLRGHQGSVTGALALPDGRLLSWSDDDTLRLWASDGHELSVLRGHEGDVTGALALPDGRLLSWSSDRTLRLWASDGRELSVLRGHESAVWGALALSDGRLLSWSRDRTLRLWASDGRELSVLHGHEDEVYGVLALPDGRLLSWSGDGTLRLWSADGAPLAVYTNDSLIRCCVALAADRVAIGDEGGRVIVLEVRG